MSAASADQALMISWSQLRVHMECKQKAYLMRTGRRNPAMNIRGFFHGMVVDSIMRDWLADPNRQPGTMPGRVDEYISRGEREATENASGVVKWKHASDRDDVRSFCTDLLIALEPILNALVLPYQFQSALTFKVPIQIPYLDGTPTTIYLRGEMDLFVVENNGDLAIWDLKGTRDDSYWRKVLGQLLFYDLAALALNGRSTARVGLIQPLCRNPVLQWRLDDKHRRQIWSAITNMANDLWRGDMPCKTDSASCAFCDVKHACARYAPVGNKMPIGPGSSMSEGLRRAARETPS